MTGPGQFLHDPAGGGARRIRVAEIQAAVCQAAGLPMNEMTSQRRGRGAVKARQIAMYLARELTPLSLPQIGRQFGNRDHTTVLHACRKIAALVAADVQFAGVVDRVRMRLAA